MATIAEALAGASPLASVSDSWRLDAELLLAGVLGERREYLHTWPERELAQQQARAFQDLLRRRQEGEPVAYLIGRKAFWDFELSVNANVLIPRPETELLVERALELGDKRRDEQGGGLSVADLGTGSGAIAIAVARSRPDWQLVAVDLSEGALDLARANADALAVPNIQFRLGSWCEVLADASCDLIIANPPYVGSGDPHLVEGSLPFEPQMALVAAEAGLADLQAITRQGTRCLKCGGWLLMEHGFNQSQAVRELLTEMSYRHVESRRDLAGVERMVAAQWMEAHDA